MSWSSLLARSILFMKMDLLNYQYLETMNNNIIILCYNARLKTYCEKNTDWTNPEMIDTNEVELSLPRFKLEEDFDLESFLTSLGMCDAFHGVKANFSRMPDSSDLVFTKVLHKALGEALVKSN